MPEIVNPPATGVSRRSMLKASAWSVPVVAVAVATPLAAASVAVDLTLTALAGDSLGALSPDQSRMYMIAIPARMFARTLGPAPTAAGSTLVISYDSRLLAGPSVSIDSVPAVAGSPTVSGNTSTVIFTLPAPVPVTDPGARINLDFATANRGVWLEDVEPFSIVLLPPSGSDSNSSNNGWTSEARYDDTSDAVVSGTWRPAAIVNGNGSSVAFNMIETLTITANAPGDIASGGTVHISGPSATNELAEPYTYVDTLTNVTVTSALLDGVDVSALIGTPIADRTFSIPVNTAIAAGQSLVLALDVETISSVSGWVWPGASASFSSAHERDQANNNVQAPPV